MFMDVFLVKNLFKYLFFFLQPGEVFDLTITWTPGEEGGVRELIIFVANGVVKHQAVLLGRANAPKKKKVTQCLVIYIVITNVSRS